MLRCERASVCTTHMLWIISVLIYQRLLMRRSLFFSDFYVGTGKLLWRDPTVWAFPSGTATTGWMRGPLQICEGVKYFLERSVTPSWSLLWQVMMCVFFFLPLPRLNHNTWKTGWTFTYFMSYYLPVSWVLLLCIIVCSIFSSTFGTVYPSNEYLLKYPIVCHIQHQLLTTTFFSSVFI